MVYYTTTDEADSPTSNFTDEDPAGGRLVSLLITLLVLVLVGAGVWNWGGWER